jgi:hypothetical protein
MKPTTPWRCNFSGVATEPLVAYLFFVRLWPVVLSAVTKPAALDSEAEQLARRRLLPDPIKSAPLIAFPV